MADPKTEIGQDAIQIANSFKARVLQLQKDKLAAQLKAQEIEASLHAANVAIDRLDSFRPLVDGDLQCPNCWIAQGANSSLIPQPSDDELDRFRCRDCGYEAAF